jgi:probable F420-dependent oxidoreductase
MTVSMGRTGLWSGSRNWPEDPGAAAEAGAQLEELGYRALWLGMAAPGLELPATVLAATRAMTVATGIVSVWAAPAAEVAAACHRVTAAHPGRFLLGLGASHAFVVERSGQQYTRPYQKTAGFLDELDAASPPVPPQGRILAALGPRMLALAGTRTSGAHPYLVIPEHTRQAREILGAGPLLAPEQMAVLDTDPGRARGTARAALGIYLQAPNYIASLLRLGFTQDDIGQASDRLVDALVVWGDEDAIARRVAEHHQAGADHVCVQVLQAEPGLPWRQWRELAGVLG